MYVYVDIYISFLRQVVMCPRLTSNSLHTRFPCLYLPSAGVKGLYHHAWFDSVLRMEPGALCMLIKGSPH